MRVLIDYLFLEVTSFILRMLTAGGSMKILYFHPCEILIHVTFILLTWLIHMTPLRMSTRRPSEETTFSCVWHFHSYHTHTCEMTHSYDTCENAHCGAQRRNYILIRATFSFLPHSYVWHDWFIRHFWECPPGDWAHTAARQRQKSYRRPCPIHERATQACLPWQPAKPCPPYLIDILKSQLAMGWLRPIGCLQLQVIFRKRAANPGALLRKMTYKDKASYGSTPHCIHRIATPYPPYLIDILKSQLMGWLRWVGFFKS